MRLTFVFITTILVSSSALSQQTGTLPFSEALRLAYASNPLINAARPLGGAVSR